MHQRKQKEEKEKREKNHVTINIIIKFLNNINLYYNILFYNLSSFRLEFYEF